jgi:hypothetical protein
MKLFDPRSDQLIVLLDVTQNNLSRIQYQGNTIESTLRITIDTQYKYWIEDWLTSIYSLSTGRMGYSLEYKREIYIQQGDFYIKLFGAFPISQEIEFDLLSSIKVEIHCDHYESAHNFPELIQIFRDKTIDQILN